MLKNCIHANFQIKLVKGITVMKLFYDNLVRTVRTIWIKLINTTILFKFLTNIFKYCKTKNLLNFQFGLIFAN